MKRMMYNKYLIALAVGCLAATKALGAPGEGGPQIKNIVISADAVSIDGTDLVSKQGKPRYFSLSATEKALGQPTEKYLAGLVYSWRDLGIHLQQGGRGPENGKWFKFQVYLHDDVDGREKKRTNKFPGHVSVDGIDLVAGTKFSDVRAKFEKLGYTIKAEGEISIAEKGQTQIFTVEPSAGSHAGTTDEIQRVEVWSGQ